MPLSSNEQSCRPDSDSTAAWHSAGSWVSRQPATPAGSAPGSCAGGGVPACVPVGSSAGQTKSPASVSRGGTATSTPSRCRKLPFWQRPTCWLRGKPCGSEPSRGEVLPIGGGGWAFCSQTTIAEPDCSSFLL